MDFWLSTEDLPVPENRVTTDKDGNVHLTYSHSNEEESDRLYGELKKILNHVGMAAHHVHREPPSVIRETTTETEFRALYEALRRCRSARKPRLLKDQHD